MSVIRKGETPKYILTIKDSDGNVLDPSDSEEVTNVRVYIYEKSTGTELAKFSLSTLSGYDSTYIKTVSVGSPAVTKVQFLLTPEVTNNAKSGVEYEIQVTADIPDSDAPSSTNVVKAVGRFNKFKDAK